ncbi:MAG: NADPH cytochrome P450 oxidoreductase family protein [Bacteroidota bacterium]
MFSGWSKRFRVAPRTNKVLTQFTKEEAEYVVLVGSETGNTRLFAEGFQNGLVSEGKKVYVDELDNYTSYPNAKSLVVFTSSFGDGDAPGNATNFEEILNKVAPAQSLQFAVVGFGSTVYPNFCQFAIDVDTWLEKHESFTRITPLVKINEQSKSEFRSWLSLWNQTTQMEVELLLEKDKKKRLKYIPFKIIENSNLNVDDTAVIRLRPQKRVRFKSGDLLNVLPKDSQRPRLYSIARIDDDVLLSVRKHPSGLCSSMLCGLKEGNTIAAAIEKNTKFHFPSEAPAVWMIANGTGIAPYLGMLKENSGALVQLTWGGRTKASFECYKGYIQEAFDFNRLEAFDVVLSRDNKKQYVQDRLANQEEKVAQLFDDGGTVMICGSMAMQQEVLTVMDKITLKHLDQPLSAFQENGQLLMDCY